MEGLGRVGSRLKAITPAMTMLVLMGVTIATAILAGLIIASQARNPVSKGATLQLSLNAQLRLICVLQSYSLNFKYAVRDLRLEVRLQA